jgi:fructosamine-3-kinase
MELWSQLKLKLPSFFSGLEILPSLLHGDLWGGNVGETCERPGKIIIYFTFGKKVN